MVEQKQPKHHKRHEEEEHGPHLVHDESNWLVSYADMMTLLMGFFVLMYSFSRVDRNKFDIVSKEVAKYFGGKVQDKPSMRKVQESVEKIMSQAGLKDGAEVVSTDAGIVLKFNGALLFKPGSAELLPEMHAVLTEVITSIQKQKKIEEVTVEGHTDDDPISSPVFPTNWELSSARASRIVRQFEAAGYPPDILIAQGYGSSRPAVPNNKEDGTPIPENKALNRRVLINLKFAGDVDAAKTALDTKDFSEKIAAPKPTTGDNLAMESQSADKSVIIPPEDRMKIAAEKLKEAEARLKEAKENEDRIRKARELEAKVKELEQKAAEAEMKASRIRAGMPAEERAPASSTKAQKRPDGTYNDNAIPLNDALRKMNGTPGKTKVPVKSGTVKGKGTGPKVVLRPKPSARKPSSTKKTPKVLPKKKTPATPAQ